eukprot:m.16140 g.16140  ORF g.16140 m.16140 type:complete len:333 (+) comp5590_c0_seq1:194-1192(+)
MTKIDMTPAEEREMLLKELADLKQALAFTTYDLKLKTAPYTGSRYEFGAPNKIKARKKSVMMPAKTGQESPIKQRKVSFKDPNEPESPYEVPVVQQDQKAAPVYSTLQKNRDSNLSQQSHETIEEESAENDYNHTETANANDTTENETLNDGNQENNQPGGILKQRKTSAKYGSKFALKTPLRSVGAEVQPTVPVIKNGSVNHTSKQTTARNMRHHISLKFVSPRSQRPGSRDSRISLASSEEAKGFGDDLLDDVDLTAFEEKEEMMETSNFGSPQKQPLAQVPTEQPNSSDDQAEDFDDVNEDFGKAEEAEEDDDDDDDEDTKFGFDDGEF